MNKNEEVVAYSHATSWVAFFFLFASGVSLMQVPHCGITLIMFLGKYLQQHNLNMLKMAKKVYPCLSMFESLSKINDLLL